jgi:tRNA dimethylallyltransferase
MEMNPFLCAVMGPTASGKSALAEALAIETGAQLINADAFQVYRGMDIGTAKPADRQAYELLDLKNPDESFGVGEFASRVSAILKGLFAEGRSAIVVGGTGLYVRALMDEYADLADAPDPQLRASLGMLDHEERLERLDRLDPDAAKKVDRKNPVRVQRALERAVSPKSSFTWNLPDFRKVEVAVVPDPAVTKASIENRVHEMVHNGWIGEVERLVNEGYGKNDPGFRAIGYRTILKLIRNEMEKEDAVATTIAETNAYAKRQRTWLRSEPNLHILDADDPLADVRHRLVENERNYL